MQALTRACLGLGTLLVMTTWAVFGLAQDAQKAPAKVIILVPQDDAILTIDGEKSNQRGEKRTFETPPLEPGKKYFYNVTVFWEPNNYTKITRKRKVNVYAGKDVTVDLRKHDPNQPDDIVVRYVPTPQEVVEAMLKLANVKEGDIVYDLGCGDGRLPVTAVSKFKAKKGIGYDIDPERIKDSEETAKRAGVTDKVEFRLGDVLKIKDLSDANVVTLYMGDDLNNQLKPILQKTLKPGSRVVSHRFLMGDWKPDKTETIRAKDNSGEEDEFDLHLWTIK